MYTLISILIIVICLLLGLIVLIQNSKGGGLAANFASSAQVMGVKKTTDTIEKLTWGFAIALMVFSMVANFTLPTTSTSGGASSAIQEQIDNAPMPAEQAPAPQQQQQAQPQPQPAAPQQ